MDSLLSPSFRHINSSVTNTSQTSPTSYLTPLTPSSTTASSSNRHYTDGGTPTIMMTREIQQRNTTDMNDPSVTTTATGSPITQSKYVIPSLPLNLLQSKPSNIQKTTNLSYRRQYDTKSNDDNSTTQPPLLLSSRAIVSARQSGEETTQEFVTVCTPVMLSPEDHYRNSQRLHQQQLLHELIREGSSSNCSNQSSSEPETSSYRDCLSPPPSTTRSPIPSPLAIPLQYQNINNNNRLSTRRSGRPKLGIPLDNGIEHIVMKRGNRWPFRWVARHLCMMGTALIYHAEDYCHNESCYSSNNKISPQEHHWYENDESQQHQPLSSSSTTATPAVEVAVPILGPPSINSLPSDSHLSNKQGSCTSPYLHPSLPQCTASSISCNHHHYYSSHCPACQTYRDDTPRLTSRSSKSHHTASPLDQPLLHPHIPFPPSPSHDTPRHPHRDNHSSPSFISRFFNPPFRPSLMCYLLPCFRPLVSPFFGSRSSIPRCLPSGTECRLCRRPYSHSPTLRGVKAITPESTCFVLSESYEGNPHCVVIFEWSFNECDQMVEGIWPVGATPKTLTDQVILSAFARAPSPKWIFSCSTHSSAKKWEAKIRCARKLAQAIINASQAVVSSIASVPTVDPEAASALQIHQSLNIHSPQLCRDSLLKSYEFGSSSTPIAKQDAQQELTTKTSALVFHLDDDDDEDGVMTRVSRSSVS